MADRVRRIAVMRALQLGDMLCAVPALRSLRAAHPEAHISLIGLPWTHELRARFPELIDEVLEFPGWPGIPEQPYDAARTLGFLAQCQSHPFDLVVQLHGSGVHSNAFVQLMGARTIAGFHPPGLPAPGPSFVEYEGHGHESERLLRLADHLGWPDAGRDMEFPLNDPDLREWTALAGELQLQPNEYVVVHCGARDPARRWAPEKFAAVADALAEGGLRVLLTGVESERPQVEEVAARMNASSEVVCGRTSLGGMACLLEHSRLLVANDTGVSHIAAALATPSVIVFTHSEPERWAAPDARRHRRFIGPTALTNSCCHQDGAHRCLADGCRFLPEREGRPVEVASVIEAALELSLDRTPDVAPI